MGWTFHHHKPRDPKAEIARMLTWGNNVPLHISQVGQIYFAAVKLTPPLTPALLSGYETAEDGSVTWCAIFLTSTRDGEWGYKSMTEDMGPVTTHCKAPPKILKLLSPTTHEYALRFRTDCWEWHNRAKPKVGETVRLREPIPGWGDTFQRVAWGRNQSVFRNLAGDFVRLGPDRMRGAEIQ